MRKKERDGGREGIENYPSSASIHADPKAQGVIDSDCGQSLVCLQHLIHAAKRNFCFVRSKGVATV